jgi:hypothetical protein
MKTDISELPIGVIGELGFDGIIERRRVRMSEFGGDVK